MRMTRSRSANSFCTRTQTIATRIAVNSPRDPRRVGQERQASRDRADHQEARPIAIVALTNASWPKLLAEVVGDRRARDDREHAERRGDRNLQQRQVRRDDARPSREPAGSRRS